jgi:TRAP-type C4-dicarboxylate transport system permease large subunit
LPESKWWVADQRIDATYAAGVLGGLLGSLGVTVANAGKKKEEKNNASAKKEIDELKKALTELSNAQQYQTIRVITPLRIEGAEVVKTDPITGKEIDNQSGKLK